MKHIVCFSGGKDSTALILWAKENLPEFIAVFCDTGWEHPITYAYIEEINHSLLDGTLVRLKSQKYTPRKPQPLHNNPSNRDLYRFQRVVHRYNEELGRAGFVQMSLKKGRVPSPKARFCTEELKVKPMIAWLKTIDDEITVYQGIRADESQARARMRSREWSDDYDAWVERPLMKWSATDCFDLMKLHGVKPNPLYLMGAGRVGCFPCVMVNMRELKAYLSGEVGPELKRRLFQLEPMVGRSFFEPTYIPERFCTGFDEKSRKPFPWAADVFRYIESVDEDQLPMFPTRSCMSVYNLCE